MKEYEHQIIWLDYFNRNLSKSKGRRANKSRSVFDPSIEELVEAARSAGYEVVSSNTEARYPRRYYTRSSYIMIRKRDTKSTTLNKIGEALVQIRSKKK
jgi:signal recognition particle subunit SRP19